MVVVVVLLGVCEGWEEEGSGELVGGKARAKEPARGTEEAVRAEVISTLGWELDGWGSSRTG